jgi:predicted Zn finger-like uncharacterized protein
MTIRQALRGWYRFLWMGLLGIGVLARSWQPTWVNHVFRLVVLTFLVVSVVGVVGFGFRCPRCRASFAKNASDILMVRREFSCPKCRISIDEPIKPSTPA